MKNFLQNINSENNCDNTSSSNEKDVSLQKTEQQDAISQRISQSDDRAQITQNGRLEEVSIRLCSCCRTFKTIGVGSKSSISKQEIEFRIAETYAKENGIWIPITEIFNLGVQGQSGNENDTYFSPDGYVYKVNNLMNSVDKVSLFKRLLLHNKIFPETSYELVGFTGFDGRSIYPVLKQKAINNPDIATPQEIE